MNWIIEENKFSKDKIALNGSKFLLGNGYMGYRGTLDDYGKNELAACTLSGVYDRVGNGWREPINAPNGLSTSLYCNGELVSSLTSSLLEYKQCLDIKSAVHTSELSLKTSKGITVKINSERFLSVDDVHLLCNRYSFLCTDDCEITINTGIDGDVWDINGPHLKDFSSSQKNGLIFLNAHTCEMDYIISTAECIFLSFGAQKITEDKMSIFREIKLDAKAGTEYCFTKYVAVCTSNDGAENVEEAAAASCSRAMSLGYDALKQKNIELWQSRWNSSDVQITGDSDAQLALRYSIYHLLAIAPTHTDKVSIPARGLSGQVYKGAIFWDTEMFMLPFFMYTNPLIARNLLKYRYYTLEGARRKAAEYGYRGAFYAWESQDTGDDACTLFNVTDIFTGRPMRTYFRDRQIHVSADVAYGIWQYFKSTGDESLLLDGGAEIILECARFYYSYSYFKKEKNRYELLNVVGPDEYHERVDNNAFTNIMVKAALKIALDTLALLKGKHNAYYNTLISSLNYDNDLVNISEMYDLLYTPSPDSESKVIEQFDGYFKLENVSLDNLKTRLLNPNEYLGGGNGLATTTCILKQADVVMMLSVFRDDFSEEVKRANWKYYEERTEHGSSLSPCAYSIVASDIGKIEWAYKYFMKTASIDLNSDAKQYLGTLYIGGTHPAANGGAWMGAILGFGGISCIDDTVVVKPKLPSKWDSLSFSLTIKGQHLHFDIFKTHLRISSASENCKELQFSVGSKQISCTAGQSIEVAY